MTTTTAKTIHTVNKARFSFSRGWDTFNNRPRVMVYHPELYGAVAQFRTEREAREWIATLGPIETRPIEMDLCIGDGAGNCGNFYECGMCAETR